MRQLRCACRAAVSPLCPYHAAARHIERLKTAGIWFRDRPLFPDMQLWRDMGEIVGHSLVPTSFGGGRHTDHRGRTRCGTSGASARGAA